MASRAFQRFPRPGGSATVGLVIFLILVCGIVGYMKVRHYVVARLRSTPVRPIVVLENQPSWMSAFLAETIADSARPDVPSSPFDKQVLVNAYDTLKINPWIKKVNEVRRVYGKAPGDRLEVDCVYHTPAALVEYDNRYTLIADDRTILPEQFSAEQLPRVMFEAKGDGGHTRLRIIQGVVDHPTEAGAIWAGEDVAGGLKMAALLAGRPFADEIVRIDVSNAAGRRDPRQPFIVLLTKQGTQIRWGRPPGENDFTEASPGQKLAHLQEIYAQYHRIDADQPWIDLRFDHVIYPIQQASIQSP